MYRRWEHTAERFSSTVQLYLLARDYGSRFPFYEAQFVSLVNALESYHRQKFGDEDERGKRIPLKNRLDELFQQAPEIVNKVHSDLARFRERIIKTRDYFSHFSESMEAGRFGVYDMRSVIPVLEAVIEVLVMMEMGFSRNQGIARAMGTPRFQYVSEIL